MKRTISIFLAFLTIFFSSTQCSSFKKKTVREETKSIQQLAPTEGIQAIMVNKDMQDMGMHMALISAAAYNTVLVRLSGQTDGLTSTIKAGHSNKLKLLASIEDENADVKHLVNTYNLDGFVFDLEDLSSIEKIVVDIIRDR